ALGHNPEFHRIQNRQARVRRGLQHLHLEFRLDICQEEQFAFEVGGWQYGMKPGVDAELSIQRIARIHIHMIAAGPAKGTPLADLQAIQVNRATAQEIQKLPGKIGADNCDQVDLVVKRGSRREKRGSSAENLLNTIEWSLDCIKSHRANDQNRQTSILTFIKIEWEPYD